jgi:translation initiation factor 6
LGLHLVDVYKNPNIGLFLKASDKVLLVPKGLAPTKCEKLSKDLEVSLCHTSIGGSRLLGPLSTINGNGVLLSRMAEQGEVREIASGTGVNVARLESRYTAVGNLVAANDKRALVSPVLEAKAVAQVRDVLATEVERMSIREYYQVGALVVVTNSGAAVYPELNEQEVQEIGEFLGVEAYPTPINGGVPYVASGLVANTRNAVAGNQTTGPELVFITRALKV